MVAAIGAKDRKVRKFVFDFFLRETFAPSIEEVYTGLGIPRDEAYESIRRLENAHHLRLIDGTARILMAFPFSAVSTPFRVTRPSGQRYFANCAWDAVAFHPMLKEPIEVHSFCHHCGEAFLFRVASGGASSPGPERPLVFLALPAAQWWDDIVRTCANTMMFFASPEHLARWEDAEARSRGAPLTIEQTVAISEPLYARKLELDYERPSKEVLEATFASLGLTGPFWRL